MAENNKKQRDLNRARPRTFNKAQFISDVCNDKYILIVGGQVILSRETFPEVDGDIDKYILDSMNNSLQSHFSSLSACISALPQVSTDTVNSGADMIRNLLLPVVNDDGTLDHAVDLEDLCPELKALLQSRLFPFVMTTTIDDGVEQIMQDVWGKRLRVVNFADPEDWRQFEKEIAGSVDMSNPSRKEIVYTYRRPTLIYIFGKAVEDTRRLFLKTDDDAILFIEKWLNTEGRFISYLKQKRVLALGCKFDDWYFRFFWYILKRDIKALSEGEVAFSLADEDVSEHKLKEYLNRKSVFIHPDARAIMSAITRMLTPEVDSPDAHEFHELMLSKRGKGEIFISYCSRDFDLAARLFLQLTSFGYQVWFDHESLCGGDYTSIISQAISGASVVLTLLTPTIARDLELGSQDHFYIHEWRLAVQIDNKRVIPVALNGYSLRASYHSGAYESIVGHKDGVDLMTEDFNKLQQMIEYTRNSH